MSLEMRVCLKPNINALKILCFEWHACLQNCIITKTKYIFTTKMSLAALEVPRSCDYDVLDYGSNYYRVT